MRRRKIFLSHAWAADGMGRDNHRRVRCLATALRRQGWRVWIDDDMFLSGNLDVALSRGILSSDAVVICLTRAYCAKISEASERPTLTEDNCFKELMLTSAYRRPVVPVLMEPNMEREAEWGPVLCMRLGGHIYADATTDPVTASSLHRVLCGLFAGGPLQRVLLSARHVPTAVRL